MTTAPSPLLPQEHPGTPLTDVTRALVTNVERVVRGRRDAVERLVVALLSGGHALLEDVPGTGKTTMARALARSVGGSFQRIQGTADLLPADITGSSVWDQERRAFSFVPGPVFANVLLVDEVNRTPPRTQSAFLEVMDEGAATVDGVRHPMPSPFFVVATQNPVEQYGTYPLPESQLDRFAVRILFEAISGEDELLVVREQLRRATVDDLSAVIRADDLVAVRHAVREVFVAEPVLTYALTVARATRHDPRIRTGASSRAAIALVRCAQARAVLDGRGYVSPGDVKALAAPVLAHRLVLDDPSAGGPWAESVVRDVVARVPVPVGD
jgi:MoxR-like ATPase